MSLLRLLTSGRSLVGLQQPVTRYRMKSEGMLPRFGGNGNPFRQTTCPKSFSAPSLVAVEAAPAEQLSVLPEADQAAAPDQESAQAETPAAQPTPPAAVAASSGSSRTLAAGPTNGQPGAGAVATPKVSRFTSLWSAARTRVGAWFTRTSKPASARAFRPLRQAELSLETVRVVRNDLSDCDLEVVRPRPQPRVQDNTQAAQVRLGVGNESVDEPGDVRRPAACHSGTGGARSGDTTTTASRARARSAL